MSESHQREAEILEAARRLPPADRTAFLENACGSNVPLRQRIAFRLAENQPTVRLPPRPPDDDKTLGAEESLPPGESVGDFIGRYKLLEKIGEGGFGMVYVAEQTEPVRRRVALKITKLGMDTKQVVARFEAERQALAMMDHPNIAKVIDAGATPAGRPYFVMELVRGIKITDYCDDNRLSTRKRLGLFIQICRAIEHAHQKGIIHRDIKPSNILVTLHDGVPVCKVIDFGIAKATQGALTDKTVYTQFDQFIGTPAYMSPEQAEMSGLEMDARSDIYSLGVVLYELLTGHTPFEARNLLARGFDEMRRMIREIEPLRPSRRLRSEHADDKSDTAIRHGTNAPRLLSLIRGDLDWIVMKCLEKDRTRRYASAADLTAEIERFLAHQPVMARPPGAFYRFHKLILRNQLAFAAGTLVLASLLIGLGVTTWFVIKEKDALDLAEITSKRADAARRNSEAAREQADASRHQAEVEKQLADLARQKAEAALAQSEIDRARAQASEKKARQSQQEAEAARRQAETALQQAQAEHHKADLAEKKATQSQTEAESSREQAVFAENRAISEAGKSEKASRAAQAEADARRQAESASAAFSAASARARAALSNLLAGLAVLSPADGLKAAHAFFTPADESQPWASQFLPLRGQWRARQGDWTNAIHDFSKALLNNPGDQTSTFALAPLLLQTGDLEGYRRQCAHLLFLGPTQDPANALLIAGECLLAPSTNLELAPVTLLARRALDLGTNDRRLPQSQFVMGLAEYRQGHYSEATNWIAKSLAGDPPGPAAEAEADAVLALAQCRLQQLDEAASTLSKATQLMESKLPKPDSGDLGPEWPQWIMAHVLIQEARSLIPPHQPAAK